MHRPSNLPDFERVQGYQQIHAGEVWGLFKKDFPQVQEQPALASSFETFGLPRHPQISFGPAGVEHNRFWFLTENGHELIQFQSDKFLHNWRKVGSESNEYPRFERIFSKFSDELKILEAFFQQNFSAVSLDVNQCEVTYVNLIYLSDITGLPLADVFSFLKFATPPDEVSCNFTRHLFNTKGERKGRVYCNLNQAHAAKGPCYRLEISVKGMPDSNSIADALSFIENGRISIVKLFKEVTAPAVHNVWGLKS